MRSSKHSSPSFLLGFPDLMFLLTVLVLLIVTASLLGCGGTKVLISQSGALVRAGPNVEGRVYQWDGTQWVLSSNKVRIPEGWYIAPLDD